VEGCDRRRTGSRELHEAVRLGLRDPSSLAVPSIWVPIRWAARSSVTKMIRIVAYRLGVRGSVFRNTELFRRESLLSELIRLNLAPEPANTGARPEGVRPFPGRVRSRRPV
jgi:hypothetical protein